MKKIDLLCKLLLIAILVLVFGLGGMGLYKHGGLRQYLQAGKYIREIESNEKQSEAWSNFIGKAKNQYSGIYAGRAGGMIWIWGRMGLRPFMVDKYSIFTYFDGCSEKHMVAFKAKQMLGNDKYMYFNVGEWEKKVVTGDLVIVMTLPNSILKAKEIYTYNYWPFIQKDQDIACAK